jgi:hypothetical protein
LSIKESAQARVADAHERLAAAQEAAKSAQDTFALACQDAYELGLNDREMAELTGYSRARIQQFRKGDPRKRKATT